jgi:hypothetical protein
MLLPSLCYRLSHVDSWSLCTYYFNVTGSMKVLLYPQTRSSLRLLYQRARSVPNELEIELDRDVASPSEKPDLDVAS